MLEDAACHDQLNLGGRPIGRKLVRSWRYRRQTLFFRWSAELKYVAKQKIVWKSKACGLAALRARFALMFPARMSLTQLRLVDFLTFLKIHQQGRATASVPRLVRSRQQPQVSVLLEMERERGGGAAWPTVLPKQTNVAGPSPCREFGLFPLLMEKLHTEEAERVGSKDRKRLNTIVSGATWTLNWMHGEFSRLPACLSSSVAHDQKISLLLGQSQRRIEELSLRALDSCRALGQKDTVQGFLQGRSRTCFRPRRQLFQLMSRESHSLNIWGPLLAWSSCIHRRMAICSLETLSVCCGRCRSWIC